MLPLDPLVPAPDDITCEHIVHAQQDVGIQSSVQELIALQGAARPVGALLRLVQAFANRTGTYLLERWRALPCSLPEHLQVD